MNAFGSVDLIITSSTSALITDETLDLDIDNDEFFTTTSLTTSISLTSDAYKEKTAMQAQLAQCYIDSLSTEQLAELDELARKKEQELLSKDFDQVSINGDLKVKVPNLESSSKQNKVLKKS